MCNVPTISDAKDSRLAMKIFAVNSQKRPRQGSNNSNPRRKPGGRKHKKNTTPEESNIFSFSTGYTGNEKTLIKFPLVPNVLVGNERVKKSYKKFLSRISRHTAIGILGTSTIINLLLQIFIYKLCQIFI